MCKKLLKAEQKPEPKPAPLTVDYVAECEKSLTRRLDRKVRIVTESARDALNWNFMGRRTCSACMTPSSLSEKRRKSLNA